MFGEEGGVDTLTWCDLWMKTHLLELPRKKADSCSGSLT